MFVALSLVSLKGMMVLGVWENQTPKILFSDEWTSTSNTGLSADLVEAWKRLLSKSSAKFQISHLQEIFVVSGPGSFTGIRVGAAFAAGLAAGLGASTHSLSTYDLFDEPVGIPVRMHIAVKTNASACCDANLEFLFAVPNSHPVEIECRLPKEGDFLVGVADAPEEIKNWPTREQMERALTRSGSLKLPLVPEYGINPKISGVRT